jgi:hypothetical protein
LPQQFVDHLELKETILAVADDLYTDGTHKTYWANHEEFLADEWAQKYVTAMYPGGGEPVWTDWGFEKLKEKFTRLKKKQDECDAIGIGLLEDEWLNARMQLVLRDKYYEKLARDHRRWVISEDDFKSIFAKRLEICELQGA